MSNLAVGFEITQLPGCGSLEFTDTTVYGPGGGSGELPSYADIGKTTIEFDLNNGETIITTFVPTEDAPFVQLFAGDFGYVAENIPDQIATVTYTIYDTGGSIIGAATTPVLFSCNFQTCYASRVLQAVGNNCCGKNELLDLAMMNIRFAGIQATIERNSGCATGAIEDLTAECLKACNDGCQ